MSGADQLPLPDGVAQTMMVQGTNVSRIQGRLEQTLLSDGSASERLRSAFPEGVSSEAIDTELSVLSGHVQTATGNMGSAGQHIWDFGASLEHCTSTVEALQTEWDELDAWFDQSLDSINSDPYYTDPANQRDKAEAIESIDLQRENQREDIKDRYDSAVDVLGDAARTAASSLTSLTDGFVPASQQGSAADIAAAMTAGTTIADGDRQQHVAEEEAEEASDLLEQAENGDTEALEEFNETYGDRVDDPYFAVALMQEMGAEGLDDTSQWLMSTIDALEGSPEQQELLRETFGILGTAYTTSTGSLDEGDVSTQFDNVDPQTRAEMARWQETWLNDLQATGRVGVNPHTGQPYDPSIDYTALYGYDIQSQLLAAGMANDPTLDVGRDYMETVGVDMVAWDQEMTELHPYRTNYQHSGGSLGDLEASPLGDLGPTDPRRDPLHNLLVAAGTNEQAAYGLLLADPDGSGGAESVMDYYISERGNGQGLLGMTDLGTTMGDILESYALDDADQESVQLAQQSITSYNEAIERSEPWASDTAETRAGMNMMALRPAMGTVMATYIDDLHAAFDGQGSSDIVSAGDNGTWDIHFSDATLNNLHHMFGDLGYDRPDQIVRPGDDGSVIGDPDNPPALQRILNASYAHTNNSMYEALSVGNMDSAQSAFGRGSYFDAFVLESLSDENGDSAGALDSYNQYMQDMANEGIGLVPFDDIPVVGGGVDKVVDWAKDPVLEAMFDTGNEDASRVDSAEWQQAQNAMVNDRFYSVVAAAGSFDGVPSPAEWAESTGRTGPEPFWNEDGSVVPYDQMTSDQRAQFISYLNDHENGAGAQYGSMTDDAEGRMNDARTRASNDNVADQGDKDGG